MQLKFTSFIRAVAVIHGDPSYSWSVLPFGLSKRIKITTSLHIINSALNHPREDFLRFTGLVRRYRRPVFWKLLSVYSLDFDEN
jgi:hypothetical protein